MNQKEKHKLEILFLAYGAASWKEGGGTGTPPPINELSESTKIYGKFLELIGKLK